MKRGEGSDGLSTFILRRQTEIVLNSVSRRHTKRLGKTATEKSLQTTLGGLAENLFGNEREKNEQEEQGSSSDGGGRKRAKAEHGGAHGKMVKHVKFEPQRLQSVSYTHRRAVRALLLLPTICVQQKQVSKEENRTTQSMNSKHHKVFGCAPAQKS